MLHYWVMPALIPTHNQLTVVPATANVQSSLQRTTQLTRKRLMPLIREDYAVYNERRTYKISIYPFYLLAMLIHLEYLGPGRLMKPSVAWTVYWTSKPGVTGEYLQSPLWIWLLGWWVSLGWVIYYTVELQRSSYHNRLQQEFRLW